MSLTTLAPRTTLPQHSAGWRVMRLVTDRGGKNAQEWPLKSGKRRAATTAEKVQLIKHQIRILQTMTTQRETRP